MWFVYLNFADNEGCSLRCINTVTGIPLLSYIRSGTSCKTVEGFNGVCLETMCAVSLSTES